MNTKTCKKCFKNLPLTLEYFTTRGLTKSGVKKFTSYCRTCEKSRHKIYRKENGETLKVKNKEYREKTRNSDKHIIGRLVTMSKRRAKEKGLEHSITVDDIPYVPKNCPVLGIELKCNVGNCASKNSPSLDRKNNKKGYIKDNVEIISFEANSLKGDATSEKLYKVALYTEKCEGKGNWLTRLIKKFILSII